MANEHGTYLLAAKSDLESARNLKLMALGSLSCLVFFVTAGCFYATGLVFEKTDSFYLAPMGGLASLVFGFFCGKKRFEMTGFLRFAAVAIVGLLVLCYNLPINDLCLVSVLALTPFMFGSLIGFLVTEPTIKELHLGD